MQNSSKLGKTNSRQWKLSRFLSEYQYVDIHDVSVDLSVARLTPCTIVTSRFNLQGINKQGVGRLIEVCLLNMYEAHYWKWYIWYWQLSVAPYVNNLIYRDIDLLNINSAAMTSLTHEMVGNITCAVVILSLVMLTVCICCVFIRITDDEDVRIEDIALDTLPRIRAPDNQRVIINTSRRTQTARLELDWYQ